VPRGISPRILPCPRRARSWTTTTSECFYPERANWRIEGGVGLALQAKAGPASSRPSAPYPRAAYPSVRLPPRLARESGDGSLRLTRRVSSIRRLLMSDGSSSFAGTATRTARQAPLGHLRAAREQAHQKNNGREGEWNKLLPIHVSLQKPGALLPASGLEGPARTYEEPFSLGSAVAKIAPHR
jgi:hypothetical protein